MKATVEAKRESRTLPTYGLGAPEKHPLFFEKRVYQGSCGKVYPVPFIDKVYDTPEPKVYDSVRLENEYVRLVILPEIGGRIFLGQDKANRDYDFFYRQDVIKPALVGLAGPWISGGVEFNWPQHHRPGTYMPADVHIEEEPDGARTVWLSEHDPLNRLKGMHGIRLRPGSALVELRARLFNRTPVTQTFLWWANVAARVHDRYQSFFPPDVHYVADHAVRAQSSFPVAKNFYYGVNYAARPGANDLTWYRNIPVPTSYMVCETRFNFFGGYDYAAGGGFLHVADRHLAPGKKQWTWGNHEFGWAWDRELTDANGPYVELMAGVYTDNQPDFSYLAPYETKTFSQYWWPYQKIGPVQNATEEVAVRLVVRDDRQLDLGVVASRRIEGARIILRDDDRVLLDERVDLAPDRPWQNQTLKFTGENPQRLELAVAGRVSYRPVEVAGLERHRSVATEPPMPPDVATMDELYLIAEHLEQYRHPTRYPEIYWDEMLRRDPHESRAHLAYGQRKLNQGLLDEAAGHFENAIRRLTHRHPNPCTGAAHYYLGLVRRFQGREAEAYAAFSKSTWNYAWRAAGYYELAMLDCRRGDFTTALRHCEAALDTNRQNNKAHILKALALRKLGRDGAPVLAELLAVDPLDHWARHAAGDLEGFLAQSRNDAQTVLDVAYDYAAAGFRQEAIQLLELHHARAVPAAAVPNPLAKSPLTHYALAWLTGNAETLRQARALAPDYFFPSRLHDQLVLEWAVAQPGADRNAAYGLGNYLFDKKRHADAIASWETARAADPGFATVWRNLGIAYWNVRRDGAAARAAYQNARKCSPNDARLFAEFDQLRAKLNDPATDRLEALRARLDLVAERDDCTVALAALYNATGQPEAALATLLSRRFHPWEGGEGKVLRQYTTARLLLGEKALTAGQAAGALEHFQLAMQPPANLGEAYHLLQAKADVNYWTGRALRALGREAEAIACFEASASEAGDFQAMAVTEHSELSYYRGLALRELGREAEARALFADLAAFAQRKLASRAKLDYFATSLPLLLVFEDDLDQLQHREADHLLALAKAGQQGGAG
jgi:tetratricopeptide (TPR) repeat protein